ncbi:hypothetical protein [Streptomyces sp. NPDC059928]|uniref:nuclear transport factor 2 family protein n=1 Tax=unclassified Streptomyces TaxID=2593676 RepID=UPI00364AAACE
MSAVEDRDKAVVREAFDTLFHQRDHAAAEQFRPPEYIQHSSHVTPGRDGLFDLGKGLPAELRHKRGPILAEGDRVVVHRRYSGHGQPAPWIVAGLLPLEDGILVEDRAVIEEEVSRYRSLSKLPMFGDHVPEER